LTAGTLQGVCRSTDGGMSWSSIDSTLRAPTKAFAAIDTLIFAGTSQRPLFSPTAVFTSSNNSENWIPCSSGPVHLNVTSFAVSPGDSGATDLFAGTNGGLFCSVDTGRSWTTLDSGLTDIYVTSLLVSGGNIFAGTFSSGLFLSTNNGRTWNRISTGLPSSGPVWSVVASGKTMVAGTDNGLFGSANGGATWKWLESSLGNAPIVTSLALQDSFVFATAYDGFSSAGGGLWRCPLSDVVTGVTEQKDRIPSRFRLDQNYPNPFNPSTTISFSIPVKSFVTLKIYDIVGREVATIVSEEMSAGSYSREWNGVKVSSGIYFCRLEAGPFLETIKLILMK
jgi:photosystem II stability/assembly factor-like uncharacterized protein